MSNDIYPGSNLSTQEQEILRAVRNLKYGTVEITVHDRRIVEVSRQEKIRFQPIAAGKI